MNRILKGINWLAAGVLGWAGVLAWLQPVNFLGDPDLASPVVVGSLTLALLLLVNGSRGWIRRWSPTTVKRVMWGLVALLIIAQLVVACSFIDVSRADAFYVRTQALALVQGQYHWLHYFMIYPNNVNFTLLEASLIKVITSVIASPWVVLNGLRFLWIDTALVSSYYLLKRWRYGCTAMLGLLVVWIVSPPVYAYALYAYTDALVMPLVIDVLAVLTWALNRHGWQKWGGVIAGECLLAIGVAMKSNLVVFEIAFILLSLVLGFQHRVAWQTVGGWLLSAVVTLGVVFSLFGVWRQQAGFYADAKSQLPATSWIAMSLNPKYSGQYDHADFESVHQQPTAAAKQRRAKTMISRRVKQLGVTGFVGHLAQKMRIFWATGDFDSFKLTTQWIRAPHFYVTNQRQIQFWLVLMTQAGYLTLLIEAGVVLMTARVDRQGVLLIALTILGLTAFHVLFWEVEPRYALPLLPGLALLGVIGMSERAQWTLNARSYWPAVTILGGLALLSGISLWQTSRRVQITQTMVAVQGNGHYVENMTQRLRPEQAVTQTIQTASPSNQLDLSPIRPQTGMVAIQIEAGNRLLVSKVGTPRELRALRYATTNQSSLRVTVTNVGHSSLKYGVVKAFYNPVNGALTKQPQNYLRYVVRDNHATLPLSPMMVSVLVATGLFGSAWLGLKMSTDRNCKYKK
ncbi:hypothetical protein [Lactiplantibacillus paraxiangfangensis]|uniref:hypothetical protein n=1 Tax=Lactiplantibacillus paraxiangfangensis TaxID=3076224 RepID=UPI0030C7489F